MIGEKDALKTKIETLGENEQYPIDWEGCSVKKAEETAQRCIK